jgi:outer membrane receptor protein involved in Fe transport
VTGRVNYIHGYNQVSINPSLFNPANPVTQPVAAQRRLPSLTTYDLYARYRISSRFSVSASVRNLTNEEPPFDPSQTLSFFDFQTYDYRGRMVSVGVKYSM